MTVSVCTADVSPQTQIYTLLEQQQRFWNQTQVVLMSVAAALLWVPPRVCVFVCACVGLVKERLANKDGFMW